MRGRIDRHNAGLVRAFWTARWSREKDMTPPKDVMIDVDGKAAGAKAAEAKPQTGEEMDRAWRAWAAVYGDAIEVGEEPGPPKRRRQRVSGAAS